MNKKCSQQSGDYDCCRTDGISEMDIEPLKYR